MSTENRKQEIVVKIADPKTFISYWDMWSNGRKHKVPNCMLLISKRDANGDIIVVDNSHGKFCIAHFDSYNEAIACILGDLIEEIEERRKRKLPRRKIQIGDGVKIVKEYIGFGLKNGKGEFGFKTIGMTGVVTQIDMRDYSLRVDINDAPYLCWYEIDSLELLEDEDEDKW